MITQTVRGEEPDLTRASNNRIPAQLTRRYDVLFNCQSSEKAIAIRDIKAEYVGKLINMKVVSLFLSTSNKCF